MTATESHHRPVRPVTEFTLPDDLAATEPPEARGLPRDGVRLLAALGHRIEHTRFADLGRWLHPGDLLVVNTSATRAAAVDAEIVGHGPVVVHFSIRTHDNGWVIEVRTAPTADRPNRTLESGAQIILPDGERLTLLAPEPVDQGPEGPRLWRTQPLDPALVAEVQARHGRPIRYSYLTGSWPLDTYQTVFAETSDDLGPGHPDGSAEMPSAGRPFSTDLVTRLSRRGVLFAPITLHAGVSSPEHGEPPAAEWFRVPDRTAALVNWTRNTGGRVIAVGTTVTRALESATQPHRDQARTCPDDPARPAADPIQAARGWTTLVLGPERPARVVDGLITGMHAPEASHLLLLEAVAGADLVQRAYAAAVDRRYRWHEFGDSCLLVPTRPPIGNAPRSTTSVDRRYH